MALAALTWIAAMGARLIDLQVLRCDEMRAAAADQQERQVSVDARRGLIYDREGRELAMSIEVDSMYADQATIEDPGRAAAALAPALGLSAPERSELARKLTGSKQFVWVRRKIDPGLRDRVAALGIKGIGFTPEHRRFYPHGDLASHVLGFVGMDNQGMEGIERLFDAQIRGADGKLFALRDARGKRFQNIVRREPSPGHGIVLTLDATIQHLAQRALRRAMKTTGASAGCVLVMQPASGDVLALANEPTFNPNRPGESSADNRRNRAVTDGYEPGSTFKVVTMAAALEENLVRPTELFDCQNGSIRVGRQLIRDHKSFSLLTATEILERSSNVGAIKIGLRLPGQTFHDYMTRFGFGARTGIQLPGEIRGLVRAPREWSGVSQATLSFGQELSATPLQVLTAINAVANDGVLQPPRLVLRELDGAGQPLDETPPAAPRRVISSATAATLRRMMQTVVDTGTAVAARMPGYSVAGKTGTAQKIGQDRTYEAGLFMASFAGFVPASRPALTMLVVLDEPAGSLFHGGDIAAPVFREIALPALRYLGVPPEPDHLRDGEEDQLEGQIDEATLLASERARGWQPPRPRRAGAEKPRRERKEDAPEDAVEIEPPAPLPAPASVIAGSQVLLPDLGGHSLRDAVRYLSRIGLSARLSDQQGVVIAQQPEAGATLASGSEVMLYLGRPEERQVTPPASAGS